MKKSKKIILGTIACFIIFANIIGFVEFFAEGSFIEGLKTGIAADVLIAGCILLGFLISWMVDF
jgi:hypothetical protein